MTRVPKGRHIAQLAGTALQLRAAFDSQQRVLTRQPTASEAVCDFFKRSTYCHPPNSDVAVRCDQSSPRMLLIRTIVAICSELSLESKFRRTDSA
jgi:hypothetical protein